MNRTDARLNQGKAWGWSWAEGKAEVHMSEAFSPLGESTGQPVSCIASTQLLSTGWRG